MMMMMMMLTGAPADAAGGEDEDGWHGDARGEERRCAGALQRPQRFPLQTGQIQISEFDIRLGKLS